MKLLFLVLFTLFLAACFSDKKPQAGGPTVYQTPYDIIKQGNKLGTGKTTITPVPHNDSF
jgi:hypothetical protein